MFLFLGKILPEKENCNRYNKVYKAPFFEGAFTFLTKPDPLPARVFGRARVNRMLTVRKIGLAIHLLDPTKDAISDSARYSLIST